MECEHRAQKVNSNIRYANTLSSDTKIADKLTPSSSKCTLSTLRPAGRDTVKKYALEPNEFESDQSSAFANDRPRTSKL